MVEEERLRRARLLIVDDQEANVCLLEVILRRAGYTGVESTTDSRRAVDRYDAFAPDILLLDLHMPQPDGFAIMRLLAQRAPRETYFPILVLTAETGRAAKQEALSLGAKDFLNKPFDPTEALLRIRNLLETRLLYRQLQRHNQLL